MRLPVLLLVLSTVSLGACTVGDGSDARAPGPSATDSSAPRRSDDETCEPVSPRRLPSGTRPGAGRPFASGYGDAVAWGEDTDRLVQLVGGNPLGLRRSWPEKVTFRESKARVTTIGDPGQIAFVFRLHDCIYTNWIGPGISLNDAKAYISTY